jgi:hypothetical protein
MTDMKDENHCDSCDHSHSDDQSLHEGFKLTAENYPDVKYNLLYFIQIMISNTYTYLGFVPIPGTEEVMFKLDEARKAIDLVDTLYGFGKSILEEADRRDIEAAIAQLRINFVNKSNPLNPPTERGGKES